MITEATCHDIVWAIHDNRGQNNVPVFSITNVELYRRMLARYSLSTIDDTIKWLQVCDYINTEGPGLLSPLLPVKYTLTDKGKAFATSGRLPAQDRKLVYLEDPYKVFVARQFCERDKPLFEELSSSLRDKGYEATDGVVEGLDSFRGEIIRKIRDARLFICLLTHRAELTDGAFASSVWLYQETGAAIAFKKKPLILVEDGMHEHYAGELQKAYEYIPFDRSGFAAILPQVVERLNAELKLNNIPLPRPI